MNSQDYWKRREEEALRHRITDEAEYDKEIELIYRNMLDGCQKEIDSFYGKYAKAEGITLAEAKKRVSKLDIAAYERKAAKYVKDAELDRKSSGGKTNKRGYYFSAKANEEMRLYNATMKINRLEMLKANIGVELIKGHDELEKFMSGVLQGRTEDELKRQAGILGKTVTNNAQKAHAIVNASYKNATFSDRVWMYHDLMKNDLAKLLQSGLIQGKSSRALARELEKYVLGDAKGGAKYNAERLMRTELARVQTEAQKQSFERNGFDEYTFLANSNCCEHCKEKDGKHFKVKDMMPGLNAPPMHPHCRCSTAAYEDSDDYEAWLDFLSKGGTTEEWNEIKVKRKPVISKKKKNLSEGMFETYNATGADSIRPRSVMNNLKTSQVGTAALRYIEEEKVPVRLCYGVDNPEGCLGVYDPFDDVIIIYCDQTKTVAETASVVVHEAKHRMLGSQGTFAEEVECFKVERLHQNGILTENDIRDIIQTVKKLYPELV